MQMFSRIEQLVGRIVNTAKQVRKCWLAGGVTLVRVTQIQRGQVLKGKRVLVTGGGSGIGLAIAEKCIEEGADVLITGRSESRLRKATEKLNDVHLHSLVWDVSIVGELNEKLSEAVQIIGGEFDVLVNNAGLLGGNGRFLELCEERWDEITNVNAKGLVFLTQAVVRRWRASNNRGKIINMSSMRGSLGVVDGPYGMSKWGVNGFTQGLGLQLAPHGIIVNGIAPGIIATDSISIKGVDVGGNAFLKGNPVARIGLSEEIAEIALFLMSDAANYIVGQTIVCDGGYSLRI